VKDKSACNEKFLGFSLAYASRAFGMGATALASCEAEWSVVSRFSRPRGQQDSAFTTELNSLG
jgi:hypothetical protein